MSESDSVRNHHPIVVQKYGGSSVATSQKLRRVAERIVATAESGKRVVVVVSAMASTTDELLLRAREVAESPSRRELDMLLSCGERASMALLAMAVHELGHEAVSLTGSQSGIMTNDRHSGARIIEVRPIRVADELERGKIVIVAGFQGVSYKREITTLGRGGSDTTAVALAAALEAEYCEICSDVDGIYSADPRIVEGAQLLAAIGCDEMMELAVHGAKVLHAGCVEIAAQSQIKVYARATANDGGGTRIDVQGDPGRQGAAGVTGQIRLVRLRGSVEHLLETAERLALPVLHVEDGQLWFPLDDVHDWGAIRRGLDACEAIAVETSLGAVSVVGGNFGGDAAKLNALYAQARAHTTILGIHASPLRVSFLCVDSAVDSLVRELHRTCC